MSDALDEYCTYTYYEDSAANHRYVFPAAEFVKYEESSFSGGAFSLFFFSPPELLDYLNFCEIPVDSEKSVNDCTVMEGGSIFSSVLQSTSKTLQKSLLQAA